MTRLYGYDDVATHADMLLDTERMRAFRDAITRVVRPGDIVVDVGSGSGILALLAAQAGAREVYAIERGAMARLIEKAAQRNGFGDVVKVFRGDARNVALPKPPTVIVSEMIGSFALDEDFLGLLGSVRARCAPDVRVIPASLSIRLALASMPEARAELESIENGLGVRLDDLAEALRSRPALAWVRADEIVSSATADARFRVGDATPRVVSGNVTASKTGTADAIIGWFEAELADGVSITSSPSAPKTHWANLVFPLPVPLPIVAGETIELEVRPRLFTDRGTWSWCARTPTQEARGDAMRALVGDRQDMLRQLGMREDRVDPTACAPLAVWAAALAGGVDATQVLVRRLRAAYPQRFANDGDAEDEVFRLVRAASR